MRLKNSHNFRDFWLENGKYLEKNCKLNETKIN